MLKKIIFKSSSSTHIFWARLSVVPIFKLGLEKFYEESVYYSFQLFRQSDMEWRTENRIPLYPRAASKDRILASLTWEWGMTAQASTRLSPPQLPGIFVPFPGFPPGYIHVLLFSGYHLFLPIVSLSILYQKGCQCLGCLHFC
ncbi:mCG146915 [Mus musculus]|jgi:hypothetical protein|nr:mCG146915 [Mus musculus]